MIKITYILKFPNGETGALNELDNGSFACPICGEEWEAFPPYVPNDGRLGDPHDLSTPAFGEVCPGCGIEFGVDEGCAPYAPIGWMRRQYARFRVQWLDRVGWRDESLAQLKNNLGLSEEQVRREADKLREGEGDREQRD